MVEEIVPPGLPIAAFPLAHESALGFLTRQLALNGSNVREALGLRDAGGRRHVVAEDAALFSALSGVSREWFDWRMPQRADRDRWSEVELFGHRWRSDWLLRDTRQQVCPTCLLEYGYARLEWDLQPYAACHLHGIVLQDTCRSCGKVILPVRPGLEICGCAGLLVSVRTSPMDAPEEVVRWSRWLSRQLDLQAVVNPGFQDLDLPMLCEGASPDGVYRLVQAMAGGPRDFKGAVLNGPGPWLSSLATVELLRTGIRTLEQLATGMSFERAPDKGCADALAQQMHRGVTAWDRALAAKLFHDLKIKARWRSRGRRLHQQMELFGDAS